MHTYREEQAPVWREGGALASAELGVIGIYIYIYRQIDRWIAIHHKV